VLAFTETGRMTRPVQPISIVDESSVPGRSIKILTATATDWRPAHGASNLRVGNVPRAVPHTSEGQIRAIPVSLIEVTALVVLVSVLLDDLLALDLGRDSIFAVNFGKPALPDTVFF
jgi:hypothetical protein